MPLHAQCEVLAPDLDGFHRAVGGEPDGLHPVAQPVHGLVVMTTAFCLWPEHGAGPAVWRERHPVGRRPAGHGPVVVVAHHVGEVLVQRPAHGHVEHLQAAANGQQRQVPFEGVVAEGYFPIVALGPRRVRLVVRLGPVRRRVHVRPAGEHERVQGGEDVTGTGGDGRQQHRVAPGPGHGGHVAVRQQGGRGVPDAKTRSFDVGRQSYQGRGLPGPVRGVRNHGTVPSR